MHESRCNHMQIDLFGGKPKDNWCCAYSIGLIDFNAIHRHSKQTQCSVFAVDIASQNKQIERIAKFMHTKVLQRTAVVKCIVVKDFNAEFA